MLTFATQLLVQDQFRGTHLQVLAPAVCELGDFVSIFTAMFLWSPDAEAYSKPTLQPTLKYSSATCLAIPPMK